MNRMSVILLVVAALIVATSLFSQTPDWEWAKRGGGAASDLGYAISLDSGGNSYVTGYFNGTATFGSISLVSNGMDDIFIAKSNSQGDWVWALSSGGTGSDQGWDIATDVLGYSFVTGYFTDTVTFGSTTLSSNGAGLTDAFIAKIDANGNWLWTMDSTGMGKAAGSAICVDNNGMVYVTGSFESFISLGEGMLLAHPDGPDIFVAMISNEGSLIHISQAGGNDDDYSYGISTDSNYNVYITGMYGDSATFGTTTLAGGGGIGYYSIFVAKIDDNGNWLWADSVHSSMGADCSFGIASDSSGNSYIIGQFYGNVNFGTIPLSTTNYGQICVAKVDTNGNWQWAVQAGGSSTDAGFGISLDRLGNLYTTGYFKGTASFGSSSLTSSGTNDVFIAKLDNNGNWQWAKRAGGAGIDKGWSVAVNSVGNCFLTGVFVGNASFGATTLTSSGVNEIFIAKYRQSASPESPQNLVISLVGGYPSLVWDAFPDALIYNIYRFTDPYSIAWTEPIGLAINPSWIDLNPVTGNAFYRVTAILSSP